MIPPLNDMPPSPTVTGDTTGPAPPIRFADLLADTSARDGQADRFNQDGFFGTPFADLPPAMPSPPIARPVAGGSEPPTIAVDAYVAAATTSGTGAPVEAQVASAPILPRTSSATPLAAQPVGRSFFVTTGVVPRSGPARATAMPPARTPPPPRPRPVPTGAFVAVAVHAAAQGIEVAARIAGLDERERAALADAVAALLSAHGYAPAHVTITAAAGGPRQEPR